MGVGDIVVSSLSPNNRLFRVIKGYFRASFDYLASLGPEDHFAQIDSQQENHDSISEQLMAINQLISVSFILNIQL